MSHRAFVALQRDDGLYNLHYSHNGADQLQLIEPLHEEVLKSPAAPAQAIKFIDDLTGESVRQFEHVVENQNQFSGKLQHHNTDNLIEPTPDYSGVTLEQISQSLDFCDIETFVVVNKQECRTFVPTWVEPNIVRPFREGLTVKVYRGGKLQKNVDDWWKQLEGKDPHKTLDESTLSPGSGWNKDRELLNIITKYHQAIYALHFMALRDFKDDENGLPRGLNLSVGTYDMVISSLQEPVLPSPMGRGIFIEVPTDGNVLTNYEKIIQKVNELRVDEGVRLNTVSSVDGDVRSESVKDLLVSLIQEFMDDIAPFSPPPYGPIVRDVKKSME